MHGTHARLALWPAPHLCGFAQKIMVIAPSLSFRHATALRRSLVAIASWSTALDPAFGKNAVLPLGVGCNQSRRGLESLDPRDSIEQSRVHLRTFAGTRLPSN